MQIILENAFPKRKLRGPIIKMRRCSTSLDVRDMKMKTIMSYSSDQLLVKL